MLPPRICRPALNGKLSVDHAVVGAGFTGLAVARRLKELEPETDILIIDGGTVGENASGRNSGFSGSDLPTVSMASASRADASADALSKQNVIAVFDAEGLAWLKDLVARYGIDCGLRQVGSFKAAVSERAAAALLRMSESASTQGRTLPVYKQDALEELTGTCFYRLAIRSESTHLFQPAALVRGLADHLPSDIVFHEGTTVSNIEKVGERWHLTCPQARISARNVILANNAFVKLLGYGKDRLVSLFTYVGVTERLGNRARLLGSLPEWGMTSAQRAGGSTLRRLSDGRCMIRSLYSYEAELKESVIRRRLLDRFRRRYPHLADIDFEYVWGGVTDVTRGGAPFWGELEQGLFISAGYNGSGVAKGTALGRRLAELVAGKVAQETVTGPLGRPGWLPPEPFRFVGVRGTAMYEEFRAGADAT